MPDNIPQPVQATTAARRKRNLPAAALFPPLADEVRDVLTTEQAAYYLNRAPQTMRAWSCRSAGLITPIHVGTRLGWRTDDIRRLLGVGQSVGAA